MSAKFLNNSLSRINNLTVSAFMSKSYVARTYSQSVLRMAKAPTMQQVEVDEENVKQKLGDIQMAFVKKAESRNAERATKHRFYRRKDAVTGLICMGIAVGIYAYTIIAMKQEDFLDDFEMPDPLQDEEKN